MCSAQPAPTTTRRRVAAAAALATLLCVAAAAPRAGAAVAANSSLQCNSLAVGLMHTCVLNSAGNVLCFGKNQRGELGVGHSGNVSLANATFTPLRGDAGAAGARAISLTAASNSTVAVFADGGLIIWGQGYEGTHIAARQIPFAMLNKLVCVCVDK